MNIRTDLPPIHSVSGESPVSARNKAVPSGANPVSASGDQAHLSQAASLVSYAASLSDVRSEKVSSVQAAVAAGIYGVRSADIAQSLMNHMLGGRE